MKKILVTGALGHIGSKYIHSIKPGDFDKVVIMDNLSTQRYSSLFNLPEGVPYDFYEDDILNADLDKLMNGVDVVVHLAAITDATSSFNNKEKVERVNYEGVKKVALACIKNNCCLIFPSSTSVYGVQKEIVDENCTEEELQPQSPYAESKISAEKLLQSLGNDKGLRFIICRFGTIFGTSIGMRFHTAVNKFCWQAIMEQPITVWKTALDQYRPYLDLEDAVRALGHIINNSIFDGRVYNVLTHNKTVREITDTISQFVGSMNIELIDTQIMNQLSYTVANERFKKTGFEFKGNIQNAIMETINLLNKAKNRTGV